MSQKQQTISEEATLEGVGLHTGETAHLRFVPAETNTGIRFRRTDLDGGVEIPAQLQHVISVDRGTSLANGEAKMHTVEHLLAAVVARQIDNLIIEVDGPEIPILDGSFQPFFEALHNKQLREQDADAQYVELGEPVTAKGPAGASYTAVAHDSFRVSATIDFDHPLIRRQYRSFDVTSEPFGEVAPARTFGFLHEAEELIRRGLVKGVSLNNAIVLNDTGLESGELRFDDEFVRHKIGDVIGDLALVGKRIKAHVIADRPSHAGNLQLAKAIAAAKPKNGNAPIVDITRIMQHLPHRYPMLLVDRIVAYDRAEKRIVGIKNVTINEPFFMGHYPGHPVMPGVLIVEAMAQVGGLLMMDTVENIDEKVVYFMSLDNVKWRRPVVPGDQIRFELQMLQMRRQVCKMKGEGFVDGQLVAEAEMTAMIVDR
jgi:UDP-3-O-[3-hydroxymyristoyl] N-acetylglucosamine deacetylase/3-hydroxyacyl-[acyl-carrier-protein] dehydratase